MDKENKKDEIPLSNSESAHYVTTPIVGEPLQECTEKEWDASDEPYSAELLNVKKKPNRVNVFSATEKNTERLIVTEVSPPGTPLPPPKPQPEHHNLARLIQKSCQVLLEPSVGNGAEVCIKLEFPDWRNEPA